MGSTQFLAERRGKDRREREDDGGCRLSGLADVRQLIEPLKLTLDAGQTSKMRE